MNGKGRLPFEKFLVETSIPPFFAQELTFQFESVVRVCTFVPLSRHLRPFQTMFFIPPTTDRMK